MQDMTAVACEADSNRARCGSWLLCIARMLLQPVPLPAYLPEDKMCLYCKQQDTKTSYHFSLSYACLQGGI
jgi:hypothetical protein